MFSHRHGGPSGPRFPTVFFLLCLFGFLNPASADTLWSPEQVPDDSVKAFLDYYKRFLRERAGRALRLQGKSEPAQAERRQNEAELARLTARMAEVLERLARNETSSQTPETVIRYEESQKVRGSWNISLFALPHAAELLREAQYLHYRSLAHTCEAMPEGERREHAVEKLASWAQILERFPDHDGLTEQVWRTYFEKSMAPVKKELEKRREQTIRTTETFQSLETVYEKIGKLGEEMPFFLRKFPSEASLRLSNRFLDLCHEANRPVSIEHFGPVYATLARQLREHRADRTTQRDHVLPALAMSLEGKVRRLTLLDRPMPIRGITADGSLFDETSLEGKVVLLDFWATWCGPCLAEFPQMKSLYRQYRSRGFEIVGYNVDTEPEKMKRYLEKNPLPWITLSKAYSLDREMLPLSTYYGTLEIPVMLLRGRDGKTICIDARGGNLREELERLFDGDKHRIRSNK